MKVSGINSKAEQEIENILIGDNIENVIDELENDNFGYFEPSKEIPVPIGDDCYVVIPNKNHWVSGDPICAPENVISQLVKENFEKSEREQIYRYILVLNKYNDLYKIYNPNSFYDEIKRIEFLTDLGGKITKIQIMPD